MYLYIFIGLLILVNVACQNEQPQISNKIFEDNINSIAVSKSLESDKNISEITEIFSDDSNIGLARRNKIELSEYKKLKGYVVEIKFYSLMENKEWKLKQTFKFENPESLNYRPELKDFNNDGLKDFTYVSAYAARGANEIRRLFIYDRKKDELTFIKNSDKYPSLMYNKELDCLDAFFVYGSSTTVFLKIDGDLLREFAKIDNPSLDNDNNRMVYLIDKNGKEKLLREDKIKEEEQDFLPRYKNFDPPILYEYEELNRQ